MHSFLTEVDVARQINVSLSSLRRWRLMHQGPQFVKVGALVRYRPEDLEKWLATLPKGGGNSGLEAPSIAVRSIAR